MKNIIFSVSLVLLCSLGFSQPTLFGPEDCDQPHTWGPLNCHAYFERYHWNTITKKCEKVVYGGCRATNNNFETLRECEAVAGSVCRE